VSMASRGGEKNKVLVKRRLERRQLRRYTCWALA
jgi:hypothetical protein